MEDIELIAGADHSPDEGLISSLLTQFQYASLQTIQAESKCRTYREACAKMDSYIERQAFNQFVDINIAYMYCLEKNETFDIV